MKRQEIMKTYIKPSIKILLVPELMQGMYNESTPEEQLGKSADIDFDEPGASTSWDE